ncbi:MAG: hypothetical protein COA78_09275 [Blastopirellula sp.]|nr:MAG: hypothetical protein COA78_09275 [Blastopirellula sp.]
MRSTAFGILVLLEIDFVLHRSVTIVGYRRQLLGLKQILATCDHKARDERLEPARGYPHWILNPLWHLV